MMRAAAPKPSLTSRLLRHVTVPLVLTWALGAGIAIAVGNAFMQRAFDRALLDNAYAVASRMRHQGDVLSLGLTPDEVDAVLFDHSETMYLAIWRDDGSLVTGDADLRAPPSNGAETQRFDVEHAGRRLRAVALHHPDAGGYTVVVAQTIANRMQLLRELLLYTLAPQLLLLLLVAGWLRHVIRRDVRPLRDLQQAVDRLDGQDLGALPRALTQNAGVRDVERLSLAINALLGRIDDGIRAQREFAGNVAHELRTPLAGIRALAEYGLAQSDPQAQREQLQAIVQSQARAAHLVDQLLALALADESRGSLALEPVALDVVARDVVLHALPRAEQAGVDLGASGLDQSVVVPAQRALLEAVLNNLIDNALRYARRVPEQAPVVTVELALQDGCATLSVVDDGPGIAPAERERLLRRWSRGPTGERLGEGAGLGLAIVARCADLMQAHFELAHGPLGHGVRASLRFATAPAEDAAPAQFTAGSRRRQPVA